MSENKKKDIYNAKEILEILDDVEEKEEEIWMLECLNENGDNTWYSSDAIKKLFAGQDLVKLITPPPNSQITNFTQLPNIHISDTTEYAVITLHESIYLKAAYQNLNMSYKSTN